MFKAPFDRDELLGIRRNILETMKEKTFDHYMAQMYMIRDAAVQLVANENTLANDDTYWEKMDFFKKPYWMSESPYLNELYTRNKGLFNMPPTSTTTSVTNIIMSDVHVGKLMGVADWMTIQQKILFKTIITTYFRKNTRLWPVHLNMDFTFMESRDKASQKDDGNIESLKTLFKSLLSGSGPFILKILQQINTSNKSTIAGKISVAELTSDIFTKVPGLTPSEVEFVTQSFDIAPSYLTQMSPKILGSASIAEIHETYSDEFKMPAVLKFIKPLYAYYFLCELNFLLTDVWKEIASQSGGNKKHIVQCRKLLLFFIQEFIKEFDYYGEFVNTTAGWKIYNKPGQMLGSSMALECKINPFPVLILNFVKGTSLDKLLKEGSGMALNRGDHGDLFSRGEMSQYGDRKLTKHMSPSFVQIYKQVDNLIRLWFKETLWGSGFFHADLHLGNLIEGSDGILYAIDFGSCGVLSTKEQCAMITAMVVSGQFINRSSKLSDAEIRRKNIKTATQFVKTIWEICNVRNFTSEHLQEIAVKIIDKRFKSKYGLIFSSLFLDIIEYSNDIGICTNSPVLLFGRACAYIGNVMQRVQEVCSESGHCPVWSLDGVITSNLAQNPMQLLKFASVGRVC